MPPARQEETRMALAYESGNRIRPKTESHSHALRRHPGFIVFFALQRLTENGYDMTQQPAERLPLGLRITEGAPDDLPAVAALEQRSFSDPWPSSLIRDHLSRPAPSSFLARDERGTVLGYALFAFAADEAEVHSLGVDPEHRRQGIASALLNAVVEEAGRAGVRTVWLEVRRGNTVAIALYRGYGFEERGVRRRYYGNGEDAVVLSYTVRDRGSSGRFPL